jgi:hypothetical protein
MRRRRSFVFNFITYGGHPIDGLAAEELATTLGQKGMLALSCRLVDGKERTHGLAQFPGKCAHMASKRWLAPPTFAMKSRRLIVALRARQSGQGGDWPPFLDPAS